MRVVIGIREPLKGVVAPVLFLLAVLGYRDLRPVFALRQVTPDIDIQAERNAPLVAKRRTKQITVQCVEQAIGCIYTRRSTMRK